MNQSFIFDFLLLCFFIGISFLVIKKAWFYSFYDFFKFIIVTTLSFVLAKTILSYIPTSLPFSTLQIFLLLLIVIFPVLWQIIRFERFFIILNRRTINIDGFIFLHHLNSFINYGPSFIVSFFITLTFFTIILSYSAKSPILQAMIDNSYAKEIPYSIYLIDTKVPFLARNDLKNYSLFNGILFKTIASEEDSSGDTDEYIDDVSPKIIAEQKAKVTKQQEPSAGISAYYPPTKKEDVPVITSSPVATIMPTIFPTPRDTLLPEITMAPSQTPAPTSIPTIISTPTSEPTTLPTPRPTEVPKPVINPRDMEQEVFVLVNQERISAGLEPLVWDDTIAAVARAHSVDMGNRVFFDHVNPDGLTPFQRMKIGGITWKKAAENIVGTQTAVLMVRSWMHSDGHRKNILNPSYHKTGIGVSTDSRYDFVATQNFTD